MKQYDEDAPDDDDWMSGGVEDDAPDEDDDDWLAPKSAKPPATRKEIVEANKINIKKRIFLKALARTGLTGAAAKEAGWRTTDARYHRDNDPEFALGWEEAVEESIDRLEQEARRRAVEGNADYVVQSGQVVYMTDPATGRLILDENDEPIPVMKRSYSDKLLETMLRAKRPQEFRENIKVDHQVGGGIVLVGTMGEPTAAGKALGLTYEQELERQQRQYRQRDVIEAEVVEVKN